MGHVSDLEFLFFVHQWERRGKRSCYIQYGRYGNMESYSSVDLLHSCQDSSLHIYVSEMCSPKGLIEKTSHIHALRDIAPSPCSPALMQRTQRSSWLSTFSFISSMNYRMGSVSLCSRSRQLEGTLPSLHSLSTTQAESYARGARRIRNFNAERLAHPGEARTTI